MRRAALLVSLVAWSAFGVQTRSDQALGSVRFGPAPARQETARIASDGTNFFVVWRTTTAPDTVVIGGGRISPTGELLDQPSVLIVTGSPAKPGYPDVVFVGGNFLVAYRSGTSVITLRFSPEGRRLDAPALVMNNTSMVAWLATNGRTVFLQTARDRFRLLASDGSQLGAERNILNAGSGTLSVASNGDRYLIAYPNAPDGSLHGSFVLVEANGETLLSRPIQLPGALFPRIVGAASNGSSFLIAMATNGPVGFMYVDGTGNATALRTLDDQPGTGITATWSGSEYTLVWPRVLSTRTGVTGHDVVGARVDAAGMPLDTTPITVSSPQNTRYGFVYASAWNGRDTMVITGDDNGNLAEYRTVATIFRSLPQIDAEPAERRRAPIASSAAEQAGGSIASNGTLSLAAWRESAGLDQAVVRAAFVAADGQLGAPITLGDAHPQTSTATASNGRDFLVAYVDMGYRLVARRVTLEGLLDSIPIVITPYGLPTESLAAGWSGQGYVIVTAGQTSVMISGLTPSGSVAVSRQVIPTSDPADSPAVSCASASCSVTWHVSSPICLFPVCSYRRDNAFARTDASGFVGSSVVLTDLFDATPARFIPSAAGQSVFVYSNGRNMVAGRITASGVVLDGPAINGGRTVMTSETAFALLPVAVAGSGLYFVEPDSDVIGRLYWTRIDPDPSPHVASLVNLHQSVTLPVTLAASARNTYLLFSGGANDPELMAPRLYLRTLTSPDPQRQESRRHAAR